MGSCASKSCCSNGQGASTSTSISSKRISANGSSRSCCLYTQQGRKGVNQDAMVLWENFTADDVTFCGVFDGHGPFGHLVAQKVRDALPLKLASFLNSMKRGTGYASCCNGRDSEADAAGTEALYREAILKAYKAMDKELKASPNLDSFCSGCTAVIAIKQGPDLFLGNIGDSRAILGTLCSSGAMAAVQLTVDLKRDLPKEAERIKQSNGRVFALEDEPDVQRVWLPFDDAPGLAMSRAFGDFCLKEYGVVSVPEFSHRTLTDGDKFVVVASDGVWDVLSNEQVVEIVSLCSNRSGAARSVVEAAAREWRAKYPTSRMDDCAAVCLFLDGGAEGESEHEDERGVQLEMCYSVPVSDGGESSLEPCFQRNFTVRTPKEDFCAVAAGDGDDARPNWSGLEGATRVNSMVQLPRFVAQRTPP